MIALFIPCLVDQFFPEIGEAVADVLQAQGLDIDYPEAQTCCGLPFYNMGQWEAAERPARHFIEVFEPYDAIVTPSSSCGSMAAHFNLNLFKDDPKMNERAKAVAAKTHEFTSYLVNVLGKTDLGAKYRGKVTCHRSCHMRELGARDEAEQLIKAVEGVEFLELPRTDVCCGFGGSFSVKFPALSGAMGETKCATIEQSRADLAVTTDAGCMLQINGMLHRRGQGKQIRHIAELLANRIPSPDADPVAKAEGATA